MQRLLMMMPLLMMPRTLQLHLKLSILLALGTWERVSACWPGVAADSCRLSLPLLPSCHAFTPVQLVLSLEAYGADADLGSGILHERGGGGMLMAAAHDLFEKCDLHNRSKT